MPDKDTKHLDEDKAIEKVRELIKHFRTAMMVTRGDDNEPHARPMGLLGEPAEQFKGVLWFFADALSPKIHELRQGATTLVFQNDKENAYMQLTGVATVIDDKEKMKEFFTPIMKTWFPKGLDDPRLTLIRVDCSHGAFWDSPGGMLQVLGAFTKAVLTGTPGKGGESGELKL